MKEIYFAGGCFWGVQHFFSGVEGVKETRCGYANGHIEAPTYEQVYTDTTGFAETVKVIYDPSRTSLETLTDLFFCIIDPLSLNKQGHDIGTRYRTGVYYTDETERPVLESVFARETARAGAPLAVELEPLRNFYGAEERHQDYLVANPGGYCHLPLKTFVYLKAWQDIRNLLGDEPDSVARMAEIVSLLQERLRFFWVGFYRVLGGDRGEELVLGPFAGPAACIRIGYGRGVCGTAWKEGRTIVVPDVEEFPGHIACSALSKSEIVVPVIKEGKVVAVLDVDSKQLSGFDGVDALWLEKITALS